MKQALRFIAVGIVAAWVPAAFGMGSQPIPEPSVPPPQPALAVPPKSTVDAVAIYNQGVALMHEKKYKEAVVAFEKAVQAKPDFAEAHNNLGYCLRQLGPSKKDENHRFRRIGTGRDRADAIST